MACNHQQQRGMVLFVALIALVAMTLAALALIRSTDTGNVLAGNLAFKQGATQIGDRVVDIAIAALAPVAASSDSFTDKASTGYYSTSLDTLDITGSQNDPTKARVDWDHNGCSGLTFSACINPSVETSAGNGYYASYLINRLCLTPGDINDVNNSCATYQPDPQTLYKKGDLSYGNDKRFTYAPTAYYRIVARIRGPRNTISYIETTLHF